MPLSYEEAVHLKAVDVLLQSEKLTAAPKISLNYSSPTTTSGPLYNYIHSSKESSPKMSLTPVSECEPIVEMWGAPGDNRLQFLKGFLHICRNHIQSALGSHVPSLWTGIVRLVEENEKLRRRVQVQQKQIERLKAKLLLPPDPLDPSLMEEQEAA